MPIRTPPDRTLTVAGDPPPSTSDVAGTGDVAGNGASARPAVLPASVVGWSPPIDGHGLFKSLMLRLPRTVRRSLDHEQLLALRQAAEEMAWGEHPIDIRFGLPWPGGRLYLLMVAGRDRRGPHRRTAPIRVGNHASLFTLAALLVGLTVLVGLASARLLGG